MSTVSTTSGGSTLMQGVVGGSGGGGRSNKVSSVDSSQAQLFTAGGKPYIGQHQPPPPPAQSSFKPKSPYTFFQVWPLRLYFFCLHFWTFEGRSDRHRGPKLLLNTTDLNQNTEKRTLLQLSP